MQETEQDKSFMKISTFCQDLCKSQFSRNQTICANFESQMMKQNSKVESTHTKKKKKKKKKKK